MGLIYNVFKAKQAHEVYISHNVTCFCEKLKHQGPANRHYKNVCLAGKMLHLPLSHQLGILHEDHEEFT